MRLRLTKQQLHASSLAAQAGALGAVRRTAVLRVRTGNQSFPVTQGRRAVCVIVAVLAEEVKSRLFIKGDGGRIVVAHLERERGAPMQPRIFLACLKQGGTDAAPGKARVDRDRVDARGAPAFAERNERIARDSSSMVAAMHGPMRRGQKIAERTAGNPIFGKRIVFEFG